MGDVSDSRTEAVPIGIAGAHGTACASLAVKDSTRVSHLQEVSLVSMVSLLGLREKHLPDSKRA